MIELIGYQLVCDICGFHNDDAVGDSKRDAEAEGRKHGWCCTNKGGRHHVCPNCQATPAA